MIYLGRQHTDLSYFNLKYSNRHKNYKLEKLWTQEIKLNWLTWKFAEVCCLAILSFLKLFCKYATGKHYEQVLQH